MDRKEITGEDPERPKTDADVPAAIRSDLSEAGTDPIERVERLAKLRDSGAISDQEFERLKGEILGSWRRFYSSSNSSAQPLMQ